MHLPEWVSCLEVGPYATNVYLLHRGSEVLIIDPGGEGERIREALPSPPAKISVFLTHGHADHWAGLSVLLQTYPEIELLYPIGDERMICNPPLGFLEYLGGRPIQLQGRAIQEPTTVQVDNLKFSVLDTPGHSPGHLVLYGEGVLFSGDLIFHGGVGRTDLPGGSLLKLSSSLKRVFVLPPQTLLCPGHGELSTLSKELTFSAQLLVE